MTSSDIDWTVALRSSDPTEQASAVQGLRDLLHRGLKVALGGRSDVDDAHIEDFAQEALVRVMRRLDQFQGRSKFTTWAHSIALNTAFTELRRKRWHDVSLDALLADGDRMAEPEAMPDDSLGAEEERTRVVSALRQAIAEDLTPKQRAAILGELREMPFDQIVELLGTSRNAAYKMLHDARQALKKRLQGSGITATDINNAFTI
jgi:RNA polymerase sigma-70 factor (ECF subfamily)